MHSNDRVKKKDAYVDTQTGTKGGSCVYVLAVININSLNTK